MSKESPLFFLFLTLVISMPKTFASDSSTYWSDHEHAKTTRTDLAIEADLSTSIVFSLDEKKMWQALNSTQMMSNDNGIIYLPNNDGKMLSFQVSDHSNFSALLSAKFPSIRAYRGVSLDQYGVSAHFSFSPQGLDATIIDLVSNITTRIEKLSQLDSRYVVSTKLDDSRPRQAYSCSTEGAHLGVDEKSKIKSTGLGVARPQMSPITNFSNDETLSKYRLAVAANGQYVSYHGGTVASAMSAINNTVTQLNFIFERDLGIKVELVDNNDQIVFEDSNTDPFEDSTDNMNAELQSTLDSIIGSENYDVGHIFSGFGNGGNAGGIGVFCNDANKGSAYSAVANPSGVSYTNLVAHEMGHQLGANHTFSYRNEGEGVNMEPGSGTTIMSYAGVTPEDDVTRYADNYYHNISILQGLTYLQLQSCDVSTGLDNTTPTATAPNDYTIPVGTPFVLTGSGADADDDDVLTYTWEQTDDGTVPSSEFGPYNTQGANFRSRPPSESPTRHFPIFQSVLDGQLTQSSPVVNDTWETLPLVPRDFSFAFTVRDNSSGGGGVASDSVNITVIDNDNDDNSVGSFSVTSQALNNVYTSESERTVSWNVSGTDLNPISVSSVDITMSADGGETFPYVLAENVPNDGSHDITLPDVVTTEGRIRVDAVGNIFYSINQRPFSITRDDIVMTVDQLDFSVCQNTSTASDFIYETATKYTDTAVFSAENAPSEISVTFDPGSAAEHNTPVKVSFAASDDVIAGTYPIDIVATSPIRTQRLSYNIKAYSSAFDAVELSFPENLSVLDRLFTTLSWTPQSNAEAYFVEIALDPDFNNIVLTKSVDSASTNINPSDGLAAETVYYWRVSPSNFCGNGTAADYFSFVTPNQVAAQDTPKTILDDAANSVSSVISITEDLRITDLNVHLAASHTYLADLTVNLTSPAGVTVDLLAGDCADSDNINVEFDDDAPELECALNSPAIQGVISPTVGLLSSFNEQSTKGDWVLTMSDGYSLDGGSLDYFALEITTDGQWTNLAPIAYSQSETTQQQSLELTLQGLDPERRPLTFQLVELPSKGNLLGGFVATSSGSAGSAGKAVKVEMSSDGNTAYVADSAAGLSIFNISDSTNPSLLASIDTTSGSAEGLALSIDNNTIYLANGRAGLQLVDVSDPAAPSLAGVYDTPGIARDVVIAPDGNTAFVVASTGRLQIIDVTDPANPSLLAAVTSGLSLTRAVDISSNGNVLYITDQIDGLVIFDVSDPSNPQNLGVLEVDGLPEDISVSPDGTKIYLANSTGGLKIINVENPASPSLLATFDTGGSAYGVNVSNNDEFAYVAGSNGIAMIDVRVPASPVLVSGLQTSETAYSIDTSADNSFGVIAEGSSGITLVDFAKKVLSSGEDIPQTVTFENKSEVSMPEGYLGIFTFKVNDGQLESNIAAVDVLFAAQPKNDGVFTYVDGSDGNVTITGCLESCSQTLSIPDSFNGAPVTVISDAAFAESGITTLIISNTVIIIGDNAFIRNNIASATVGSNVESIGANAFAYNQLEQLSFLGNRPTLLSNSFLTNRALNYISYCPDKTGWPGSPISSGNLSISPVSACDAVNKSNTTLSGIRAAVLSGDAEDITIDSLNSVLGLENVDANNIELYRGLITFSLNLSFDQVRLDDLQGLINKANQLTLDCDYSVYLVEVGAGQYPDEISWQIRDQSDQLQASGGAPFQDTICLADDRHTLEMADNNEAGTNNGWDFAELYFYATNGDLLFIHSLISNETSIVALNVGNYPNQAPVAEEIDSTNLEQSESVSFELLASDADADPLTYILTSAPTDGVLKSFAPGSGIVFGSLGGGGIRGIAVSSDDQYAYLVDYTLGLIILDIKDIQAPTVIGQWYYPNLALFNVTVSSDNSTAYVSSASYGILSFDVSDPADPRFLDQLIASGTPLSVVLSADGATAYVAAYDYFMSVDVSDPSDMVLNNEIETGENSNAWDIAVSSNESLVYLASSSYMQIYDVSDAAASVLVSNFEMESVTRGIRLSKDDKTVFVANGAQGFQALDVSDASQPQIVTSIPSDDFMSSLTLSNDGRYIYSADASGNLKRIDVNNANDIRQIRSNISTRDAFRLDITSDGKYVFVADGYTGFKIIDVSFSAKATGDKIEPNVTYIHNGGGSSSDEFLFKVNDGLDDSNIVSVGLKFRPDQDDDGVEDDIDNCPSIANPNQFDTDEDMLGDLCDEDDDGDGVPDASDAFPLDSGESIDSDGDGVGDNSDWAPNDSSESADSDGDGVGDNADAFPADSAETADSDGDGVGDNSDWAPNDSTESADTDGDGVGDNADAFPADPTETLDTDDDGEGDNTDADIDGDGVLNGDDPFPARGEYSADSDNDGMPDAWEARFGLDPSDPLDATLDADGDGITNLEEFLAGTSPSGSIDIDGNSDYDALTDGLLLLRGMFGLTDAALITGTLAVDAVYTTSAQIESRITLLGNLADIDGNGKIDALTDGLLTLRYLFGLEGESLTAGVVASDATRTSTEIEAHLASLMPSL